MGDMPQRIEVVKVLLEYFKVERYLYIALILISIVILLISGIIALAREELDYAVAIGLFGPGGAIVTLTGRLLKMWNDAVKIILASKG